MLENHAQETMVGFHGYYVTSFVIVKIEKIPSYFDEMYFRNKKRFFNSILISKAK